MTKVKILVSLVVVALLLFPALAFAQGDMPQMPCRFYGTVQIDGANVADGTVITATVEGDSYTATTPAVYGASTYSLEIAPPAGTQYDEGATITFMIGSTSAEQTSSFEAGGNVELDLSSGEAPANGGTGGGITNVVVNTLATGASATADYNATTGVLTLGIPAGEAGADGIDGVDGADGAAGPAGKDAPGGIVLPIIALIVAVIAVIMAMMSMRRRV
ncbi:MAG: hypothetical protein SVO26_08005 [Chloroflexota bacterium]|nr:hypothetical protein [Chloroflexota bacterium]